MTEWDVTITYDEPYPGEAGAARLLGGPIVSAGRSPWSDRLTLGVHVVGLAVDNAVSLARLVAGQALATGYGDDPTIEWPVVAVEALTAEENERRSPEPPSIRSRFVTASEAAEMLGISARAVRNHAAALGGEQVGDAGWIFPRATVEADAARRRELRALDASEVFDEAGLREVEGRAHPE